MLTYMCMQINLRNNLCLSRRYCVLYFRCCFCCCSVLLLFLHVSKIQYACADVIHVLNPVQGVEIYLTFSDELFR